MDAFTSSFSAVLVQPDRAVVWKVSGIVDNDGHLNLYIISGDGSDIYEIETTQGDGKDGEQLALRFTTEKIEQEAND